MPSIEIHMNLLLLPLLAVAAALLGFLLRSAQIRSLKQKVISLENEMLHNHAEILTLQKEIGQMQAIAGDPKTQTPVVSIKETNTTDDKTSNKKLR